MSQIKSLKINNWIGLEEFEHDFGKVNIISGPKGIGKTSIVEAAEMLLLNKKRRVEVIRHDTDESSLFLKTTDGLEISRKIRNGKADYMKVSKVGEAVPSTEAYLRKLINGDIFRPLDFVEKTPKEQAAIILNMLEIPWTMSDIENWFGETPDRINFDCHILKILKQIEVKYYEEREALNREINILKMQIKDIKDNLPENYDGDHWRSLELAGFYKALSIAEENNKQLELSKAFIDGFQDRIAAIKAEAENERLNKKNEIEAFKSETSQTIADSQTTIDTLNKVIESVDTKIKEMSLQKNREMQEEIRKVEEKYNLIMLEESKSIELEAITAKENIIENNIIIAKKEEILKASDKREIELMMAIEQSLIEKIKVEEAKAGQYSKLTLDPIDTTPLKTEAENVAKMQSYLRDFDRMEDVIKNKLSPKEETSKNLTAKIEKARILPQELLKLAKVPVPGLSVDSEGRIRIGKTLISDLSEGEQLELAFRVAKSQVGELKVICVDGINKINESDRKRIESEMNNDEYQYFVLSTENGKLEVTIKDGE